MPESKFKREKLFYSIKEVADMFDVKPSLLRYWEKEFPSIHPPTTVGKTRQYRKEDIEEIRRIHHLVKVQGVTLSGAKQKLKNNRPLVDVSSEVVERLTFIREELMKLKVEFDELDQAYEEAVNP
ncbi:MAG: HTH-type transcriptional regulator MlrA [Candidatus Ordinivivax streblomastigis]|uniref:HTH-type transcriptional regulator MlrA n=1 Tax=Candidatus Ordinivivax streblomastigis TaxID=2540710 RepID=A0A5M8P141_9BACT|nr:MAG: HTH-type transcriptional regulator MlrA [Candidatus Ordinivivax streblomastigis]